MSFRSADLPEIVGVHTYVTHDPIQNPFEEAARNSENSAIKDDFRYFAYWLNTPKSWYEIDLKELKRQSVQVKDWKQKRYLVIGFIDSFSAFEPRHQWWLEGRLANIARTYVEDAQNLSTGRQEFTGTDGIYDYFRTVRIIHPEVRASLRRKVLGQLHNYIGLVDKQKILNRENIYPFFLKKYEHEIAWAELLTNYLRDNRKMLTE